MIIHHRGHHIDTDKIDQLTIGGESDGDGHRLKIAFTNGICLECDDPDYRLWETLTKQPDQTAGVIWTEEMVEKVVDGTRAFLSANPLTKSTPETNAHFISTLEYAISIVREGDD